jgi:catalase
MPSSGSKRQVWCADEKADAIPAVESESAKAGRSHSDYGTSYSQAGVLFCLMTTDQRRQHFCLMTTDQRRQHFDNIAAAMQGVPHGIVHQQLAQFTKADPAYGAGVRGSSAFQRASPKLPNSE